MSMDEALGWVGRTTEISAYLDPMQANRMAVTLDRAPSFAAGDALPPAWHWLFFPELVEASRLGEDGHPARGITMPPVPLPRRMWAAGSLAFQAPLVLGTVASRTSTISAITPKEGRTGRLCFVTVDHEVSSEGRPCLVEQQTIVYRELDAGAGAAGEAAPEGAAFSRDWSVTSTTLFRYSALTFNGHRIHYDVDYARDVEGYPNLVIHGPLIATLLADLAVAQGRSLSTFEYRARSPLFLPDGFRVNGQQTGEGLALWASSADGRLAMSATATLA